MKIKEEALTGYARDCPEPLSSFSISHYVQTKFELVQISTCTQFRHNRTCLAEPFEAEIGRHDGKERSEGAMRPQQLGGA